MKKIIHLHINIPFNKIESIIKISNIHKKKQLLYCEDSKIYHRSNYFNLCHSSFECDDISVFDASGEVQKRL